MNEDELMAIEERAERSSYLYRDSIDIPALVAKVRRLEHELATMTQDRDELKAALEDVMQKRAGW